jgi:tetratricopeptide (TPR) repeat protein
MTTLEKILDTSWNYNDVVKSEAIFKDLLSSKMGDRAEILTQIARAQGLQRKLDEAQATLDEAEGLIKDERVNVRYLLERGRLYNSANQRDKARPLFLEAYNLAKSINADFYTIDAAHMMAIVEPAEQQLHWHEICLELCETTTDECAKQWLGSISNNAAWTYHDLGNYKKALEVFQKALAWQEASGKAESILIAKWSVARTLRSLGEYHEALDIQHKLLQEKQNDGYIYEELGECLLALKQDTEAKLYFAKAYELLSKDDWFVQNESTRLERLKPLSSP